MVRQGAREKERDDEESADEAREGWQRGRSIICILVLLFERPHFPRVTPHLSVRDRVRASLPPASASPTFGASSVSSRRRQPIDPDAIRSRQ